MTTLEPIRVGDHDPEPRQRFVSDLDRARHQLAQLREAEDLLANYYVPRCNVIAPDAPLRLEKVRNAIRVVEHNIKTMELTQSYREARERRMHQVVAAIEGAAFHPLGDAERDRQFAMIIEPKSGDHVPRDVADRQLAMYRATAHSAATFDEYEMRLAERERFDDPTLDIERDLA